ncbi:MAG TPA: DinB family protein [bacterium]|nr:DinB family protein [bacterium]
MTRGDAVSLKALVVNHIHTTLEDEEWQWQPPLRGALRGLTAAEAAWKPAPARHSIWQIVRHLTLWKRGVLDAWDGDPPDGRHLDAADWQDANGSEADWERDRRALLDISAQFLTRAEALDDAGLSRNIVWYKNGPAQPLAMRLVRTTTHDVYHAGQIMYVRALQGIGKR